MLQMRSLRVLESLGLHGRKRRAVRLLAFTTALAIFLTAAGVAFANEPATEDPGTEQQTTVEPAPDGGTVSEPTPDPTPSDEASPEPTPTEEPEATPTEETAPVQTTPTIVTNKDDYLPTETVALTGYGWLAGEWVRIFVNDDDGQTWSYTADLIADETGGFYHEFQLPEWFVAHYSVTATGETSGQTRTTFTDDIGGSNPSTNDNGNGATSLSIARPGETVPGDFLIAQIFVVSGSVTGSPEGWTRRVTTPHGSNASQEIWYRAAGSEEGPYKFNLNQSRPAVGGIIRYTGIDATAPIANHSARTGDSATLTANSIAGATVGQRAVAFFGFEKKSTLSNPGDMADLYHRNCASCTSSGVPTARGSDDIIELAGPTGSKVSDSKDGVGGSLSGKYIAHLVLLNPAAAASNSAPVLGAIGNKSVHEGSALSFTAAATDPDSGQSLAYSLAAGTTDCASVTSCTMQSGASINSSTGAFSWTPTEAQGPGTYRFKVVVTDNGSSALSDSEEITVTVAEVNAAPVLGAVGNKSVNEGSALSFTATATDSDLPANTLSYSVTNGSAACETVTSCTVPSGATINSSTGAFTWTPTETQGPGTYRFFVVVTDNGTPAPSDSEQITVTVAEVNAAPVLGAIGNKNVDEGSLLSFTAAASDSDVPANTLAYSLANGSTTCATVTSCAVPAGATINDSTGAFSWTPTEAQGPGTYRFNVVVADNGTPALPDSEEITVTVAEVNAAPVLGSIGDKNVDEGSLLSFTANATDSDVPANTLSYSLANGATDCASVTSCTVPAGATINASTGAFAWTPTEAQGPGTYRLIVVVTDSGTPALPDSEEITVTVAEVNDPPVLAPIGNRNIAEGSLLSFTASATDPNLDQTVGYSLANGSTACATVTSCTIPAGATIDASTGAFFWTPTEAQGPGSYRFFVVASDNGSPVLSDSEEITVTVTEVNAAPVLGTIGDKNADEGSLLSFTAAASDADLPANTLAYALADSSTDCETVTSCTVPAGAAINGSTGAFTWTPSETQGPGTYRFVVVVTDNGSPALSDSEVITVTVAEVNSAPVLDAIGNRSVNEQELLSFTAVATDPDVPANSVGYTLANGSTACATVTSCTVPAGAAIDASTGAFTWTPTEAQGPGTYRFMVRATDNGSPALADSEEITVAVAEVNAAPELGAIGNKNVNEQALLSFTAVATDPDLPANTLTFALGNSSTDCEAVTSCTVPAGATINGSTGAFSWTPTEAQGPGTYRFVVSVTDNGSPALSDSEVITVTVAEVNAAPVLGTIGNKSVNEHALLSFTAVATDTDLPANTLAYTLANGSTDCATVTSCTVPAGAALNPSTGAFAWTPTEAQGPGTYRFVVIVTDNGSPVLSDSEEITVTVAEVNAPPSGADKTITTLEDTVYTLTVADFGFADGSDIPANSFSSVKITTAPALGTLKLNAVTVSAGDFVPAADIAGGKLIYHPALNGNGSPYTSFDFQVKDDGETANGGADLDPTFNVITINVTPVNDAPVVSSDAASQSVDYRDAISSVTVTAADVDSAGDALAASTGWKVGTSATFTSGLPSGLTFVAASAGSTVPGTATWTLAGNPNVVAGVYTIRVTVTDDIGTGTGFGANYTDIVITVDKESAATTYTGDAWVSTAGPNVSTASVRLAADVVQEADGHLGDITLARVRFELFKAGNFTDTPNLVIGNVPVDALGKAETTASLPVEDWVVKVRIEPANGYWTADPVGIATLTVALGTTERRVTGGGWIDDAASRNGKGNFGFTVSTQKNGTPKGNSIYLFRGLDGYNYLVKSNSWAGGGLRFYADPWKAGFSGKAVVQKIDASTGNTVASFGNYSFDVNLVDGDLKTPRETDRYAITIFDSSGTVWRQLGSATSPLALGGGNVLIKSK